MTNSEGKRAESAWLRGGDWWQGVLIPLWEQLVMQSCIHIQSAASGSRGFVWVPVETLERLQRSWLEPEVLLLPSCVT